MPASWAFGSRALQEILLSQMASGMNLSQIMQMDSEQRVLKKECNLGATLKTYVNALRVVFSNLIGPVNIPTAMWTGI